MIQIHQLLALTLIPDQNSINTNGLGAVTELLVNAIDVALFLAGALSVIFIIVGGLRYVLSAGDPKNTAQAKATITYALVGLVVSVLAVVIVNFFIVGIFINK